MHNFRTWFCYTQFISLLKDFLDMQLAKVLFRSDGASLLASPARSLGPGLPLARADWRQWIPHFADVVRWTRQRQSERRELGKRKRKRVLEIEQKQKQKRQQQQQLMCVGQLTVRQTMEYGSRAKSDQSLLTHLLIDLIWIVHVSFQEFALIFANFYPFLLIHKVHSILMIIYSL